MKTSGHRVILAACSSGMIKLRCPFLLLAAVATPALAQEAIVVTATRLPRTAADSLSSQIVLDAAQLQLQASANLDDRLRAVAGFQTFRRASSRVTQPTTQGTTLRAVGGNGASRALVLRDGVPLEDPFGGWIPWGAINSASVGSVRIIRGGGSVTAGSGALTGLIEIDSAEVPNGATAELSAAGGSFGTAQTSARVALANDQMFADISGGAFASASYTLVPERQRGSIDVPARGRARNVSARFGAALPDQMKVQASLLYFTERKINGFVLAPNATTGTDVSLRLLRESPASSWSFSLLGYAKWRDFSSGFASALPGRSQASQTLDQFDVPANSYGGSVDVRPPVFASVALRLGVDGRQARGQTHERFRSVAGSFTRDRVAGGSAAIVGGFIDVSATPTDTLTFSGGVRLDGWWLQAAQRLETDRTTLLPTLRDNAPNRNGTQWSGRVGARYAITPALSARALAYSGWRLPSLNELHRPFRVGNDVTEANAALRPERLRGVDIGLNYTPLAATSLDITFFANEIVDAIGNISRGVGPGVFPGAGFLPAGGVFRHRDNIPKLRVRGAEVQAHSPLPFGFSIDGSITYVDGTIITADTSLIGKRLSQSPRWQAASMLSWRGLADRLNAAATLRHSSGSFEDDQNTRLLPAYTTLDVMLAWKLSPGLSFRLSGENLADKEIVSALASDGTVTRSTPRSIMAGFDVKF
jgi:vitamin B12 transporter